MKSNTIYLNTKRPIDYYKIDNLTSNDLLSSDLMNAVFIFHFKDNSIHDTSHFIHEHEPHHINSSGNSNFSFPVITSNDLLL